MNAEDFDPRDIQDPEFMTSQIMVGRSMLNMLEYIRQNYSTHFKDLKIEDIEHIDISLLNFKGNEGQNYSDTVSIFTGSEKTNQLSTKLSQHKQS